MSGRLIELDDRIAQWYRAYDAVRREITSDVERQTLAEMETVDGIMELSSYMNLAIAVHANDRTAASVAATLVVNGVRPPEDDRGSPE